MVLVPSTSGLGQLSGHEPTILGRYLMGVRDPKQPPLSIDMSGMINHLNHQNHRAPDLLAGALIGNPLWTFQQPRHGECR